MSSFLWANNKSTLQASNKGPFTPVTYYVIFVTAIAIPIRPIV